MTPDKRALCILNTSSPYGTSNARDALDCALLAAAFDLQVTLAFVGDGVFQLLTEQNPHPLGQKNLAASLQALELYDIHQLMVEEEALKARGLTPQQLCLQVTLCTGDALGALLQQQDTVISF
jgi:tRNA 2-thiouridine synthesizing protein C